MAELLGPADGEPDGEGQAAVCLCPHGNVAPLLAHFEVVAAAVELGDDSFARHAVVAAFGVFAAVADGIVDGGSLPYHDGAPSPSGAGDGECNHNNPFLDLNVDDEHSWVAAEV